MSLLFVIVAFGIGYAVGSSSREKKGAAATRIQLPAKSDASWLNKRL